MIHIISALKKYKGKSTKIKDLIDRIISGAIEGKESISFTELSKSEVEFLTDNELNVTFNEDLSEWELSLEFDEVDVAQSAFKSLHRSNDIVLFCGYTDGVEMAGAVGGDNVIMTNMIATIMDRNPNYARIVISATGAYFGESQAKEENRNG